FVLIILGTLGTTAGSHRLWAHHSYKASTSLKIFLMLCQTLTGYTSIYNWVRLHRLHHKYFQTDLDPHCPQKGFLYSHCVTDNLKLSPAQEKALEEVDMSDIENDKVVMFQKKYFWLIFLILTLLVAINTPLEYWNETVLNSVFIVGWFRYTVTYHFTMLIHSAINIFDFNKTDVNSYDNNLIFLIKKSYWISYHYLSPWDYQAGEYGEYGTDCTSKFIRVCAALELATDLKTLDYQVVRNALTMSVVENKPIPQCLSQLDSQSDIPKDHYLA
ncbi:acyl-CoA Delta(11) desaturase, partial [Asbolus verrucosus]